MYGLLLEMLAKGANMKAGKLICSLGDCHLYNNHIDQAKLQLSREPNLLPTLELNKGLEIIAGANNFLSIPSKNDINIKNYKHHDPIKAKLSVGQ
jgi:thymidylate synthase